MATPVRRDVSPDRVSTSRPVFRGQAGPVGAVTVGRVWRTDPPPPAAGSPSAAAPEDSGLARLGEAFVAVAADLGRLASELALRGQPESAQIAEASFLIASDPDLRSAAEEALDAGVSPRAAVQT